MLKFLKHLAYIAVMHPLSYMLGMLSSGIIAFIISIIYASDGAVFSFTAQQDALILTITPPVFFFIFMFISGCKSECFFPLLILLASLPVFIIQHIMLVYDYTNSVFIGSCEAFAYAFFIHQSGPSKLLIHVILVVLQLFVHLPVFLLGNYCGHKYRAFAERKHQE